MQFVPRRNAFFLALIAGATLGVANLASQGPAGVQDRYQWLEDVSGQRSMDWVKADNERTAKVLESDPHFAGAGGDALKVLESPERLPLPHR